MNPAEFHNFLARRKVKMEKEAYTLPPKNWEDFLKRQSAHQELTAILQKYDDLLKGKTDGLDNDPDD